MCHAFVTLLSRFICYHVIVQRTERRYIMRYELIIIWESGEKEVYSYDSKEKAKKIEEGYKIVFGNQISWTGITEKAR